MGQTNKVNFIFLSPCLWMKAHQFWGGKKMSLGPHWPIVIPQMITSIVPKIYLKNRMCGRGKEPGYYFCFICSKSFIFIFFSWEESFLDRHTKCLLAFYKGQVPALKVNSLNQITDRKVLSNRRALAWSFLHGERVTCICVLFPSTGKNLHLPSEIKVSTLWNYWEEN